MNLQFTRYKINVISKFKPFDCNKYGNHNNKVLNTDLSELNSPQIAIDYDTLNLDGNSICNMSNMIHSESGSTQIKFIQFYGQNINEIDYQIIMHLKLLSIVYDHKFDNLCINDIISNGLQSISSPFNNKSLINYVKSFQMIIIDQVPSKHKLFTLSRIVQIEPSVGSGAIHDRFKWERKYLILN